MNNSQNAAINSSFVRIRSCSSSKGVPDANEHEQSDAPVIDIEALRSISRIVLAIKERIAAGGGSRPNPDQRRFGGDESGSEADRGDRGENNHGEKGDGK